MAHQAEVALRGNQTRRGSKGELSYKVLYFLLCFVNLFVSNPVKSGETQTTLATVCTFVSGLSHSNFPLQVVIHATSLKPHCALLGETFEKPWCFLYEYVWLLAPIVVLTNIHSSVIIPALSPLLIDL